MDDLGVPQHIWSKNLVGTSPNGHVYGDNDDVSHLDFVMRRGFLASTYWFM